VSGHTAVGLGVPHWLPARHSSNASCFGRRALRSAWPATCGEAEGREGSVGEEERGKGGERCAAAWMCVCVCVWGGGDEGLLRSIV